MTEHYIRLQNADTTLSQHMAETSRLTKAHDAVTDPALTASKKRRPTNPYQGHNDPPLAESLIILLGLGGLLVPFADDNPRLFRNVGLMAGVLTLVAYGSWWWPEVLYDQQVIHSLTVQYDISDLNTGK
jgi:hypothetical protein